MDPETIRRQLAAARRRLRSLLDIEDSGGHMSVPELAEFRELSGEAHEPGSIRALQEALADAENLVERSRRAGVVARDAAASGQTGVVEQPGRAPLAYGEGRAGGLGQVTYARGNPGAGYLRDRVQSTLYGDFAARDRLQRNAREVQALQQQRGLTAVDGAGGEFVPPVWMVDQFVPLARPGRPTVDVLNIQPLPAGTDTINLPTLATGTAVAEQATQNTAIVATDATTASVSAAVTTIAGGQIVAVQLIEQSPGNVDELLLADLAADYATKCDIFALNNNAAGKRGLLNVTGVNAVAYVDATPTAPELFTALGQAASQVAGGRLLAATAIVMHTRRWFWIASALDLQNRPLVVPDGSGGTNVMASMTSVAGQGVVGRIMGLPVIADPNMPTTVNTNQDPIIVLRTEDSLFYEAAPRLEVFRETKADSLSVYLRLYSYVAFQGGRYPRATSVITGTGLAATGVTGF